MNKRIIKEIATLLYPIVLIVLLIILWSMK